jgi:hypothetical protein
MLVFQLFRLSDTDRVSLSGLLFAPGGVKPILVA